MMKRLSLMTMSTALAIVALTGVSQAQTNSTTSKKEKLDEMIFTDADRLTTVGEFSDSMTIGGGHGPVRIILARPRTSFVVEMLKSIENL